MMPKSRLNDWQEIYSITFVLPSSVYYVYGCIVTYRYSQAGIYIVGSNSVVDVRPSPCFSLVRVDGLLGVSVAVREDSSQYCLDDQTSIARSIHQE